MKIKEATNESTTWYSVKDQMAQMKNKYGVDQVNIVAHSMGGIVGRVYADYTSYHQGSYPKVKNLFMLGTPNWGSPWADRSRTSHHVLHKDFAYTPAVEYLTQEYMKTFNTYFQEIKGVRYYSIAGNGGRKDDDIPDPCHWFGDPYNYSYSMGNKLGYLGWKFIGEGEENDNLVPVSSAHFVSTPDFDSYTVPLGTYPLNHHTIRDNKDVAKCILSVGLNNDETCCPYYEKMLYKHRLYKDAMPSNDQPVLTGSMNTKNSTIAPGETQIHTFTLNQCAEVFFAISWLDKAQDIILSVKDPNNQTLTVADDPTITFAHDPGLAFYSIPTPNIGSWQIFIDGNNLAYPIAYSLTTIITGNGLSHNLTTDKDFYYQNEPVVITQTLNELDNPLLDANVIATIIDPNHNEIVVHLFDNGTHGGISAGDGIYTNAENIFNIGGAYYISSLSQGHFSDGTEFSNIDYASFSVSKAYASIVDNFSERTEDNDTDDLLDSLIIIVELDIFEEKAYRIAGELYGADDKKITWSKTSVTLLPGLQHIDLSFDGNEIFSSGIDGPYYLKNLTLWPEEESNKLDEMEGAYITEPYTHRQFQRDKITIITENISDKGIDSNENGKYDFLEIEIGLDIINEAECIIDASLTTVDRQPVAGMNRSYYLYPGINMVSVHFLGKQIYNSGQKGPYVLENLSVSNTNDNFIFNEKLYNTTISYQYTDFDKPAPNPPTGLLITPDVKSLHLLWSQGDEDVTGYKIYYGEQNGDYEYVIDANDLLSYQLTDLEGNKKYFIALTAYNEEYTESEFSLERVSAPYRILILGAGLEHPTHGDHGQTKTIISALHSQPDLITVYGYIDLGITTSNLSMENIKLYSDEWKAIGADGIFFDDAGWDFEVERARLNQAVEYAHNHGMNVVVNAWNPDDVLSDVYNESYNPDNLPTPLHPGDGYLYESYQISQGGYQDFNLWAEKADKCLAYKNSQAIKIYCVALGDDTGDDPHFQEKFNYFWWSFILYGFDYYQYTNPHYSASNGPYNEPWANTLLYHHPVQPRKYIYAQNNPIN